MFVHLPPGLTPRAPLVVVLHGCGQGAEAYAVGSGWVTLADTHGFALLCPQQTRANNRAGCFNWFEPTDIRADGGEAASILQMINHLARVADLDGDRVFATGLSAGGALALALLAIAPKRFAAGAILAGMPFDAVRGGAEAWLAMKTGVFLADGVLGDRIRRVSGRQPDWPRLSVWQGLADTTVSPANARRIVGQWRDLCDLPEPPDEIASVDGRMVSRWGGTPPRLQLTLVAGMGHGAPVDSTRPGGGVAGPFLIDNGVASALEIAADWGLTAPRPPPSESPEPAAPMAASRTTLRDRVTSVWRRLAASRR
jgi:poly(hydroxyalkanoate) depolymerase family esterase